MREILFRGKAKAGYKWISEGEWIEGSLFYSDDENGIVCQIATSYLSNNKDEPVMVVAYEVDPETVCQYTGYKDDTGKNIFEGDIVGFEDMTSTESGYSEMGCCGKVCYDEEEACFHVTDRLSAESWEVLGECHIIGNIFDNPELIGE